MALKVYQKGNGKQLLHLDLIKFKFFIIILPQTIKIILPSISNEVITLVRDTSLAQIIGVTELFSLAQKQANFKSSILPLCVAGMVYLIISVMLTAIFNYIEKKLEYYR